MTNLVVLTDLGTFKAYRFEADQVSSSPKLQPVDAYENILGDGKPSGKDSETKTGIGRKPDCQRSGWPEDVPTQRSEPGGRCGRKE